MQGVLLVGAPATGKDTVTRHLSMLDGRYSLFRKLKVGGGRHEGYRRSTGTELERLRALGLVLFENDRYGNTYAVDRPELDAMAARGEWPVVHLASPGGVAALKAYSTAWKVVVLTCSMETARARLRVRDLNSVEERLKVWREVEDELTSLPPQSVNLTIRTDARPPRTSALMIQALAEGSGLREPGDFRCTLPQS